MCGSIIGMGCLLLIDSPHRSDIEHDDERAVTEELEYDYTSDLSSLLRTTIILCRIYSESRTIEKKD